MITRCNSLEELIVCDQCAVSHDTQSHNLPHGDDANLFELQPLADGNLRRL